MNNQNELSKYFNSLSKEQIRSNIERIIASYRNIWDVFTELIQNSADAIIDQFGFNNINCGQIILNVLTEERKIIIKDNGCGIRSSDLAKILVTGESIKRSENRGKYGFMGFGFTFIAFQSEYLKITSTKDGNAASRTYYNLYKFIYNDIELPMAEEEQKGILPLSSTENNGTQIEIIFPKEFPEESIEKNLNLAFEYAKNFGLINYILRTRSAVGLLDPLFDKTITNFNFNLTVDGIDLKVQNFYLTTREIIESQLPNEKRIYDIKGKYEDFISVSDHLPDKQKRDARKAILLDSYLTNITIGSTNALKARLYLASTSKDNLNSFGDSIKIQEEPYTDMEIPNGLWLAINGLPTGICIDNYEHSTYLPFSGIIDIQDNKLRKELDAGRKGITDYRANQIKIAVKNLLRENNFIKYRSYVVGVDSRISDPLYNPKEELRKSAAMKKKYDTIDLNHKYYPPKEEQEVISLFTELISSNIIKGYSEKVLSGIQVYDGLYDYNLENSSSVIYSSENYLGLKNIIFDSHSGHLKNEILIEFKVYLSQIYRDLANNRKDINQIDILVCWDTEYGNKDSILNSQGDIIQEKDIDNTVFYGVTHHLITPKRQQSLPIIELKKVMSLIYDIEF